jgi:AcrR family transcriptional regulator
LRVKRADERRPNSWSDGTVTAIATIPTETAPRVPPRERILAAARELFYRHGIRAVCVEAIAAAADSNKMTLYRHFSSKDELVAEYLRGLCNSIYGVWDDLEAAYPDDPAAQLRTWISTAISSVSRAESRGCAFANAAVELPETDHPARAIIEGFKANQRQRLVALCRRAGASDAEGLADELFLLLEGAHVSRQCFGRSGPSSRVAGMAEKLIGMGLAHNGPAEA